MLRNYRLLFSLCVLSLLVFAISVPRTTFSSPTADATPKILAGMNIDLPTELPNANSHGAQKIVLAGGCFWGLEAVFEDLRGVTNVISGYAGGTAATANYDTVSTGRTDHAEAIEITYDPTQISYGQLLKIYFLIAHDPTQINRQSPDSGTQYRSAIFFNTPAQQQVATAYIETLNKAHIFAEPIATQLVPLTKFYTAEDYHQNFIDRNPTQAYIVRFDLPKLAHLRQNFPELIQKN
ncbi:peptide-methionine (S)-S-oxide reductase MsrA [Chamaesiphon sp.]|uniref:peptide-methionine (S)-S-oxide reductase MsrA n=1 Tax=Chamaesiphon sp. TaxID=2814140 RepID=UPI003592F3E4